MNKLFIVVFTSLLFSLSFSVLTAQESESIISPTHISIPPAPNAASLGKFGDIPVSYYTGVPNISVPIYELKSSRLSLPISLNYHASGVKADDIASWVGTSWALNAGGTISRTMRGIDDFGSNGLQFNPFHINEINTVNEYQGVLNGTIDTQPDLFYYSTPFSSGKFISQDTCSMDKNNCSYFTTPISNNIVQLINVQGGINWKVTSSDGTQFYYGKMGAYGQVDRTESTFEGSGASLSFSSFISSWHLAKIISADGSDSLLFEYQVDTVAYDQIAIENKYNRLPGNAVICGTSQLTHDLTYSDFMVFEAKLKKITSTNLIVEFMTNSTKRLDLDGGRDLEEITIKDINGLIIKKVKLYYGYFDSQSSGIGNYSQNQYRLKLDSLIESGSDGKSLPPFRFSYNESSMLPPRVSYQQDHWGFFNNNSSATLIPKFLKALDDTYWVNETGADREADTLKTKLGMLTRITYPTGGYTTFQYEPHTISKVSDQPADKIKLEEVANLISAIHEDGEKTMTFVLDKPYTAKIEYGCNCVGTIEAAVASVSIAGPNQFNYGGGCGGNVNSAGSTDYINFAVAGTYTVTVFSEYINSTMKSSANIKVTLIKHEEPTEANPYYVGGVRIKRIKDFDYNGLISNTRKFDYTYSDNGTTKSSGILVSEPMYIGAITKYDVDPNGFQYQCYYSIYSSSTKVSLGNTQGSHLGYKYVSVLFGENGENGKSRYQFTTPEEHKDGPNSTFPYAPEHLSKDFKRGFVTNEKHFDAGNSLLKEVVHNYEFLSTRIEEVSDGYVIAKNSIGKLNPTLSDFLKQKYSIITNWIYKASSAVSDYNQGNYLTTSTSFHYDNASQINLTRQEIETSSNEKKLITTKYAQDYSSNPVFNAMIQKNMVSIPVENQYWSKNGTDSVLIDATKSEYMLLSNKVLLQSQRKLVTETPLSPSASINWVQNSSRDVIHIDQYDGSGNIIQFTDQSKITNTVVWDYNNSLMIANVKNAQNGSCAFTSFESNGSGYWTVSSTNRQAEGFTGTKSYLLTNGNISKPYLNATKTYRVTLWAKGSGNVYINGASPSSGGTRNGWTYFEIEIQGVTTVTVSGNLIIDELRLFPKGAELTTYTYQLGRGLTSSTDTNNTTLFYEYDSIGRLSTVRDMNNNIVKSFQYNYKQTDPNSSQY